MFPAQQDILRLKTELGSQSKSTNALRTCYHSREHRGNRKKAPVLKRSMQASRAGGGATQDSLTATALILPMHGFV